MSQTSFIPNRTHCEQAALALPGVPRTIKSEPTANGALRDLCVERLEHGVEGTGREKEEIWFVGKK